MELFWCLALGIWSFRSGICPADFPAMTITLCMAAIGILFALIVVVHSVATAPVGYQDETGFHAGAPNPCGDDSLLENPS